MSGPVVDILLATYNGARYLPAQLDSLLAQTHTRFRLLVSDDGSTDETLTILERYRAAFGGRLTVLPHPAPGGGVRRNFERLMQASLDDGAARWIAFCDQDDVWLPNKIETLLAEAQAVEAVAGPDAPCLVHCDLTVVDAGLNVISTSFAAYQRIDPRDGTPLALLSVNTVTGCAMLINRALLALSLPMPAEAVMHDWWLAVLSGSGQRRFVPTPLVRYRQHGANQIGARDRGLPSRLLRLSRDAAGVARRIRQLGAATHAQALALQQRLRERGWDDAYVAQYLAWRRSSWPHRLATYRTYYVGPELDRLSRVLGWW